MADNEPTQVDYARQVTSIIEDLQRSMQPLATLQVNPDNPKMKIEAKRFLRDASAKIVNIMALLKN